MVAPRHEKWAGKGAASNGIAGQSDLYRGRHPSSTAPVCDRGPLQYEGDFKLTRNIGPSDESP